MTRTKETKPDSHESTKGIKSTLANPLGEIPIGQTPLSGLNSNSNGAAVLLSQDNTFDIPDPMHADINKKDTGVTETGKCLFEHQKLAGGSSFIEERGDSSPLAVTLGET